jgi:hypothetical protein
MSLSSFKEVWNKRGWIVTDPVGLFLSLSKW